MELSYTSTLDRKEARRRLDLLLVPGSVADSHTCRRIERIASRFRSYAACYPLPLWAPGLKITNEMTGLTEALLPVAELRGVFDLVLRRGCRFAPFLSGTYLHTSVSWLHFLDRLRPQLRQVDPAVILREIARDGERRRDFLFSLMLPHHFGGSFDRYPLQTGWIKSWLEENSARLKGRVRALDSACGSGEGAYGLAEVISAAGYRGEESLVHGSTVEPVELFAAAHAIFPHDAEREKEFRARVAPLLADGKPQISFYLDDVTMKKGEGEYDLILCNGLLGGPLLHEPAELDGAVRALVSRLAPGGVFLAADRFHAGWRQRVPHETISVLMERHGLTPVDVPEGVGGIRMAVTPSPPRPSP